MNAAPRGLDGAQRSLAARATFDPRAATLLRAIGAPRVPPLLVRRMRARARFVDAWVRRAVAVTPTLLELGIGLCSRGLPRTRVIGVDRADVLAARRPATEKLVPADLEDPAWSSQLGPLPDALVVVAEAVLMHLTPPAALAVVARLPTLATRVEALLEVSLAPDARWALADLPTFAQRVSPMRVVAVHDPCPRLLRGPELHDPGVRLVHLRSP
jgi:O-methyltransferase involved in polyketide biosynthesis